MIEPEAEIVDAPERVLRNGGAQFDGDALRCGVGEGVRVGVDESGDDGVCGKVSDGNAAGRGIGDGLDAIAGDEDVGVRTYGAGADVDEFAGEHGLGDVHGVAGCCA